MGKLVLVNVGMPKDARWNDKTVYTGIWKTPVEGPVAITFARSGLTVNWSTQDNSILEIAEACDVPTRFSCRSGVCHV